MASTSTQWPRYVRAAPWALVVAGLVWDSLSPADYWGDPMVAAASVLAGALLSLRDTIAVGAAVLVGILVLTVLDGSVGTTAGYLELANTAFAALIGIWVNRVVARHGRRLQAVRSVAETAQRAVLPAPPARVGRLEVAARYRAAHTDALIGGDAYALQRTPFGVRALIADVRGKGLPAVAAVSVLLGAFREHADGLPDLGAVADGLEHSLSREAAEAAEELRMEGFITALLVEFTPGHDGLRLLNCGHPGPYLLSADGRRVRRLDAREPGLPLGMGGLGVGRPAVEEWPFAAGDTLLLVTDGVTEARDAAGRFYDPAQRLAGRGPFDGPGRVIDTLIRDVDRWTGGPRDDDMAVLALTESAAGSPASGPNSPPR
ncbi:PP2C family protein-serine/threonine phosphatase [Kitasatospora sp. NPDC048540]|uniref:PP2C family protein-serine/threonine phosphatase n=1 Tax=unclassified Kitasatospora TaxID=2633591 RepID=UPI000539D64B|nr:PP2C family protein-serine/threonine phosphatase [Kitasatospora sp. MBT63]